MNTLSAFGLSACAALLTSCSNFGYHKSDTIQDGTAWVANSPEWAEEAEAVYAEATEYISRISQTKSDGTWAVVLDVDETVLNNVEYQISLDQSGTIYTEKSWYNWTQEEKATLVPGAAKFIQYTNDEGGSVALVTNRRDTEQLATENNLARFGLRRHYDFRVLLTRARPDGPSGKDSRFELVPTLLSAQGFPDVEVIAYIGDGRGDKPSEAGDWQFFCIDQGAMYGDFCADVPGPGR
ncbi:MAG: HAD family acid phosphatase [Pseudomonadota bacterium]